MTRHIVNSPLIIYLTICNLWYNFFCKVRLWFGVKRVGSMSTYIFVLYLILPIMVFNPLTPGDFIDPTDTLKVISIVSLYIYCLPYPTLPYPTLPYPTLPYPTI